MRKVTATEKYRAVNEGQMPQAEFVRQMRLAFPQHITQFNGYDDTVSILKTRGVLSETKKQENLPNTVSIDSIQRAVDIELEAMGHDPVTCSDVEAQDKAKAKALKNLKKDPLHYYNLLAKESSKVDKNDKMKETKPGAKEKDTFNDMKKAELKEEAGVPTAFDDKSMGALRDIILKYVEDPDQAEAAVQKVDDHGLDSLPADLLANLDRDEEYKAWYKDLHGMAESNQEESIANFIIKHYTNPKTGKSLVDDEIIGDFFKTHPESKDQEPQDALDNFEEYLSVNYEMPGDYMQEKVAKSADDVIDPADYGSIGKGYLKGFNKPHSLSDDQLETLGRKIVDSLYKGDFDAAKAKHVGEVMGVNRKGEKQPETDGSDASKYKRMAKGMKEAFKPGDMFSTDFDYAGMLKFALTLDAETPKEVLQALYDSFEDVNYHSENQYLGHAIEALEDGDKEQYLAMLDTFKQEVAKTAKSIMQEGGRNFVREDEKEYLEKRDKAIKSAMGKEEEETVDEGFNDHLSAEDLSDLAQFFYSYAISTEMDGYTDVAKHIDQAARELGGIEAPDKAPGMEENLNERVGGLQEFISLIQDRAAENDTSEKEEAEEVMYAIGDHYNIGVNIDQGPWDDEVNEKKGKDHDGDGDVDGDDYMAAKDKAIKKAMNENIKAIVAKVLEEGVVNEAATAELSRIADDYAGFDGMKSAIIALENIVTDIEQYYEKTRTKIQKVYDTLGEIRNEEGLKVGGFIAPAIEQAFLKDLRPVTKTGFTKGLDQPKVRTISQADIDAHNSGERPLGEEAPKETVFTPVMETKKKK